MILDILTRQLDDTKFDVVLFGQLVLDLACDAARGSVEELVQRVDEALLLLVHGPEITLFRCKRASV